MKTFFLLVFILLVSSAEAQSIHEEQSRFYGKLPFKTEAEFDRYNGYVNPQTNQRTSAVQYKLQKKVFGFNPYWVGSAYNSYEYGLLSTIAYFSYEVDPKTGNYTTVRDWKTTSLILLAQSKGTKVVLTATNFGATANQTLLSNPLARKVLIDSLVTLVASRFGDGVNIDFESVPGSMKDSLTKFMANLSVRLKASIPEARLSIDLPAVDWNNAFDIKALTPYVDDFLIMGYDYYYAGSTIAGPVAPLKNSTLFGSLSLVKSIDDYLAKGLSVNKLILAVPYYGRTWATASDQVGAATVSTISSTAKVFSTAKKEAIQYGRRWNSDGQVPYYVNQNGTQWYQTWYDDAESLTAKYDLIKARGLAGVGIWALSYDGSEPDLNLALRNAFTDDPVTGTELAGEVEVQIFPNPARRSEGFVVRVGTPASISITDSYGRKVFTQDVQTSEVHLATDNLSAGMYLLAVQTEKGLQTKRVYLW